MEGGQEGAKEHGGGAKKGSRGKAFTARQLESNFMPGEGGMEGGQEGGKEHGGAKKGGRGKAFTPLQSPPKQQQRALFGGGQAVYLLDQPQPALAMLWPEDGHESRSVFRGRESENGVEYDRHATMAGLPVRTLNPKPMIPPACLAMGFGASLAAPKGSIFSHISGARAAGRSETVTPVSVRDHSAVRVTAINWRCSHQVLRALPRSGAGPVESRESTRPGSVLPKERVCKGHKMETNSMLPIKRGVKDAYSSVSQKLSV
jgi:hypothetical protein